MPSTFGGLEIGKRGLVAQQTGLTTVSHNIANANTEGYTRERVNMAATQAYSEPGLYTPTLGQLGTGVEITGIQRLRDQFLDQQYYQQNSNYGTWDTQQSSLSKVENILNEPSDTGLQNAMNQFWQSWQDLAKDPTDSSARQLVLEKGSALTDTFHQISQAFTDLKNQIGDTSTGSITDTDQSPTMIGDNLRQINSYAGQIQNLNEQIKRNLANGYTPNDLYDQRNLVLDKLSQVANINVTQVTDAKGADTGMIKVSIGDPSTGTYDIVDQNNATQSFTSNQLSYVTSGNLKALVDLINPSGNPADTAHGGQALLDYYAGQIDDLAKNFAANFNTQTGVSLFTNGTAASNISVDVNSLPATFTIDPNVTRQVSDPLNKTYSTLISKLGSDSQAAKIFSTNAEAAKNAVDTNRQSVSGVSLDEEMTDMIKYQNAYSAASRCITAMDQMLDKLINGTGSAGL
jgi:flagellar hook-associated protein 1